MLWTPSLQKFMTFLTWKTSLKQPKSDQSSTWLVVILDKSSWTCPFD
jgi:hypothetical protein